MTTTTQIEAENYLDVRDIIERFKELESDESRDESDQEEFDKLTGLLDELKGNGGDEQFRGDWYPIGLIRDDYTEEYAREQASDCYGRQLEEAVWPFTCIDWTEATKLFLMDYQEVEFLGNTYHFR